MNTVVSRRRALTFGAFRLRVRRVLAVYIGELTSTVCRAPRAMIKVLDQILCHFLGIREFNQSPQCIFRLSRTFSRSEVTLPTGEVVRHGDPILELHFWNDRVGVHLAHESSESSLRSVLRTSLALVADELRTNPQLEDARAVHGSLARASNRPCGAHHPFGCPVYVTRRFACRGVHDLLEDCLIHLLRWAFNPEGVPLGSLRLSRMEVWISVSDLKEKFREAAGPSCAVSTSTDKGCCPAEEYTRSEVEAVSVAGD